MTPVSGLAWGHLVTLLAAIAYSGRRRTSHTRRAPEAFRLRHLLAAVCGQALLALPDRLVSASRMIPDETSCGGRRDGAAIWSVTHRFIVKPVQNLP
jgi:hypothetical protein